MLCVIVFLFSIYPTFASHMPDPLSGFQQPFMDVVPYHMISSESSFGIPMRAFGGLVIGFILFGAVLQRTGGGKFFNDLALALSTRGHTVTVFTGKPNYPGGRFFPGYGFFGRASEDYQGVRVIRVPLVPRALPVVAPDGR